MTTALDEISSTERFDVVTANEDFEAVSAAGIYGVHRSVTEGLTWGYYGGRWGGTLVSDGTFTMTNGADNYMVVLRSNGTPSMSASATNWNNVIQYARVYKVTVAGGVVTATEDHRAGPYGVYAPAAAVSLRGLTFTSDTDSTADSDPGAGLFKWNNATQASATVLYFDNQTADGVSLTTFWASLPPAGFIFMQQEDDQTRWQLWKWTITPVDGTGYRKFTVTLQANSTSAIADAKSVLVDFKAPAASYQPLDSELTAIAGLTSAADRLPYFTGSGTAALATYTAGARALDGLTYAADKIGYTTSASAASTTDLTSVARTLIAQTTQGTMRSTGLGLDSLTEPRMNYGGMNFNGTTTYLDGNALTGIADGKKGSIVAVVRFANAASATEEILSNTGFAFQLFRSSAGAITVTAENAAGTTILNQTLSAVAASAGTYVIMASWDMAAGQSATRIYVNDATAALVNTAFTDDTIDYTVAEWSVGASAGGGALFAGDMYLIWFDPLTNQDFSSASVRRKFTDANNVPQFLGSHGELPTGTPPIGFWAYSDFQNWSRNRGLSTTAFVENGAIAAASTILYGQAAPVDNVGRAAVRTTNVGNVGSGEDNLITYTLPANRLITRGCGARITAWGTTANNSNPKTVKLYFGSVAILTTALTVSQAGIWEITGHVISTGTDAQDYVARLNQGGTTTLVDVERGTLTEDDGAAITIKCTGTVTDGGGGINNDDIVNEGLVVELIGV